LAHGWAQNVRHSAHIQPEASGAKVAIGSFAVLGSFGNQSTINDGMGYQFNIKYQIITRSFIPHLYQISYNLT